MLTESFSGVRGTYGKDLSEDIAKRYAKAFLQFLMKSSGKPVIVIGRDTRPSSENLKDSMVEVFLQYTDVIDVGVNTTPAIEFAVRHLNADAGVIITASHNEPQDNGWKFLEKKGSVLEPKDMEEVIKNFRGIKSVERKKFAGKMDEVDISPDYIGSILDMIGEKEKADIAEAGLKVAVDPNGGTAAVVIIDVLEKLDVEIVEMNMELGKFKRKIEPTVESLKKLAEKVKETDADFGAGFDCDADRVELVDDKGHLISGNYVLALAVNEVLSVCGGNDKIIVTNDATSGVVKEIAEKYGAKVEEVEVGEINVVKKMYELKSPVSGEGSNGGVIIPPARCREGILTVLVMLRMLARTGKKLSEIYEELPKYYSLGEKLECEPDKQIKIKELIEKRFVSEGNAVKKTGDETGGLKIIIDDSWIWYRASKTEAGKFRIITDSKDEDKAKELMQKGINIFKEAEAELR
jgi:phosphomannomutase / phosphoglucomutase